MSNKRITILLSLCAIIIATILLTSCDEAGNPYNTITTIVEDIYDCDKTHWSPDGSKIAFWGNDFYSYYSSLCIYIWDKEGGNVSKLEFAEKENNYIPPYNIDYEFGLCWTPDGEYILFSIAVDEDTYEAELWQVSVEDGSTEKIEMPKGHRPEYPEVSPNGEWLTYTIYENETWNIWKIAIQSGMPITTIGDPIQLTFEGGCWDSRWSPDGSLLAYSGGPTSDDHIYTIPASGGTPTQITPNDENDHEWPTWSPDGAWLVYSGDPHPYCLWKIPSVGGTPEKITDVPYISPLT